MKFIGLLILFSYTSVIHSVCSNGTFPSFSGDKCFFIPNDSENFVVGELNCKQQNGHLGSVANAFDNLDLTGNAEKILGNNATYAWLGGNNLNNGTWVWTDGQPFSYTNWAKGSLFREFVIPDFSGNPTNNTGDNCLALNLSSGMWFGQNCYAVIPYICEIFPSQTSQSSLPTQIATTTSLTTQIAQNVTCPPCTTCKPCTQCQFRCPDGWSYYYNSEYCYKVFYSPYGQATFNYGESVCEQYNGHLASIHSFNEDNFIMGIHDTYPIIGLQYNNKTKTFQWTDGSPYDFTGLRNNDTTGGYCVMMSNSNWNWYTYNCSSQVYGFVCKTRPNITFDETLKISDRSFKPLNIQHDGQALIEKKYIDQCPTCEACTPCPTQFCKQTCPGGWIYNSVTKLCYAIIANSQTFSDANTSCIQGGSELASIHDSRENTFLQQNIAASGNFWIGLKYNDSLSNFTWTDNTPYDYNYFYNQPNITNRYCVFIGTTYSYWGTQQCNESSSFNWMYGFICKKHPN